MKMAFTLFGGRGWTGGTNYLVNLLSVLSEVPERPVKPILFTGYDADEATLNTIAPYLHQPPIKTELMTAGTRLYRKKWAQSILLQHDPMTEALFRSAGVSAVFQQDAWYGMRFGLPTLAWLADFQHRHLPQMFGRFRYWKRDITYRAIVHSSTVIMLSSKDAEKDCHRFYPQSKGKTIVVPFAVMVNKAAMAVDPRAVAQTYRLPEKFFFLPNQFWKHKNHRGVIEALHILGKQGMHPVVAVSGNPNDGRNPAHYKMLRSMIEQYGLAGQFHILGLIPHDHILPLMRASLAVINPSFFEGWSTTVEEAKAVGVPLLLSDLPVHREQAHEASRYFDPNEPADIARVLGAAWEEGTPGPHAALERSAALLVPQWRAAFARNFINAAKQLQ